MAVDPDARWKPGDSVDRNERPEAELASDASVDLTDAEAPEQAVVEPESPSPWSVESNAQFVATPRLAPKKVADQPGGQRDRLPRARLAVGLAAVLAIAALVVVTRDSSDVVVEDAQVQDREPFTLAAPVEVVEAEPLVDEPFAGSDRRRLPSELAERWTANLDGVAATTRSKLFVGGNNTVVGAFDAAGPSGTVTAFEPGEELEIEVPVEQLGSVVIALDVESGDERWRTLFDSELQAFSVLGIFEGVVVLERLDIDDRVVTGLDELTGELLWERRTADSGVHVALEGTSVITRVSFTANEQLTFIDPATGNEVGQVPGRLFATDFLGTWYVRDANSVMMLDLSDGWSLPTKFGTLDVNDSDAATVIDGRIIEVDNGEARAAFTFVTGPSEVDFSVESSVGVTTPTSILRLSPMAGSAFVLTGSGAVFGADLGGDVIDVRWRVEGAVIDTVATDRGLSILIARDGGASQQIVDGSTGELISVVQLLPGLMDTLEMVGNGVLMKRDATIGSERVAVDLDGNWMWSLVGNGPIAIGDEVIVTFGPSDDGVGITAYGDL